MSEYNIGFSNLNMNYLPDFSGGFNLLSGISSSGGVGNSSLPPLYSTQQLFPADLTNLTMPEFSSFGNFDPFGISTTNFNLMEVFHAQQQQNMISKMWGNFMELVKNYKMPQFDFNFNFNYGGTIPAAQYGNYTQKATDLYKGTAEDLNKNLKGVLAGKGAKLLELQQKYGVSASMMEAIINTESAHGTSNAAKTKNNVAGIMSASSNYMKLATFNSVDDCLEALAKNLKNNYINKGRVTISQIHEKYCPIGAANDPTSMNHNWGRVVADLTDKYNNLA